MVWGRWRFILGGWWSVDTFYGWVGMSRGEWRCILGRWRVGGHFLWVDGGIFWVGGHG